MGIPEKYRQDGAFAGLLGGLHWSNTRLLITIFPFLLQISGCTPSIVVLTPKTEPHYDRIELTGSAKMGCSLWETGGSCCGIIYKPTKEERETGIIKYPQITFYKEGYSPYVYSPVIDTTTHRYDYTSKCWQTSTLKLIPDNSYGGSSTNKAQGKRGRYPFIHREQP